MFMTPGHQLLRGREGLKTGEKAIPEVCFTKLDYEPGQFKSCRTLTLDESPSSFYSEDFTFSELEKAVNIQHKQMLKLSEIAHNTCCHVL